MSFVIFHFYLLKVCNNEGCCDLPPLPTQTTTTPTTSSTAKPTTPSITLTTPSITPKTTPTTVPTTTPRTVTTTAPTTTPRTVTTTVPTTTPRAFTTTAPTTAGTPPPTTLSASTRPPQSAATKPDTNTPSIPYSCEAVGNFGNSDNISTFWNCYYSMEVFECMENQIFNDESKVCETDWKRYIRCDKIGFFRNPYDCHMFYVCYRNSPDSKFRVDFTRCGNDNKGHPMVFDEEQVTCVRENGQCHNRKLPYFGTTKAPRSQTTSSTDDKHFSEWAEKEANDVLRIIFDKNIDCLKEGLFRNPYDCHKFYNCSYEEDQDILLDIDFFSCKDKSLVFDNEQGKCIYHDKTALCKNNQIPIINDFNESDKEHKYQHYY